MCPMAFYPECENADYYFPELYVTADHILFRILSQKNANIGLNVTV